jgi:biotin carboxylase
MRPVLMLFVGTRGVRIADTCNPLAGFANVVVATSDDILAERADRLDDEVRAWHVIRAPSRAELIEHCLRYPGRVDGALSFSDDMLLDTARFAAARGLPGQPVATVEGFRDKYTQRRRLAAAGLPVPAFVEITSPDQAEAALRAVGTPAILKPTRGSGSALAYVIEEPAALEPRLREAFTARDGLVARGAGGPVAADTAFILEGLIAGERWHDVAGFAPYVSVESAAVDGRYAHLAVTDRFPLAPPVLETGMMLPSALREDQRKQVVDVADAALRALGFRHGLAHVELMLTGDGPVVIEVNARAGGALPYLFPLAAGVDLVALAGQVALGQLPDGEPEFDGHAVFAGPQHPVGVAVTGVVGLDRARELTGVRAVIPLSVRPTRTDGFHQTMIAAVLGTARTPEDAVRLWREVMDTIRGEYER